MSCRRGKIRVYDKLQVTEMNINTGGRLYSCYVYDSDRQTLASAPDTSIRGRISQVPKTTKIFGERTDIYSSGDERELLSQAQETIVG